MFKNAPQQKRRHNHPIPPWRAVSSQPQSMHDRLVQSASRFGQERPNRAHRDMTPGKTSRHWSTSTARPCEQFSFWREVVCEAVMNVGTEHPGDTFHGDLTCSQYGEMRFSAFTVSPHEVVRHKMHIARSSAADYLVSRQRSGVTRMAQNDDVCELQPGDVGLVDGTLPFRLEYLQSVDRVVAVIPHSQLHSRAPWLDRRPLNRITANSPFSELLRFYLERLVGPDCTSPWEAAALVDNVCNIVALMTATTMSERSSVRQFAVLPTLDQILIMLRRHLADPDLSPEIAAARLGVSLRTLHKRFRDADTTFGKWVLENRLLACQRAFEDPRHASFTISEIAFGWGFNDFSSFSKAFRARFGVSPTEYRRALNSGNREP
jgi:AraC-like DNA-binding protein